MRKKDTKYFLALTDWQLMGLCIEREASGESLEGRIAVGTVVLERVDHRDWDGKTIKEVILKPWQFSWTMPEAGAGYYESAVNIARHWEAEILKRKALKECSDIAAALIAGEIPRNTLLAQMHCTQYLNPTTVPKVRDKWVESGMQSLLVIGHHEFFV